MIKQFIKDVCGKQVKDYWKNEGCNKRMQRYVLIKNILHWVQLIVMLLLVCYVVLITTDMIVNIFNDGDMATNIIQKYHAKAIQDIILNVYQIGFVLILMINLLDYKLKSMSLYNVFKNVIRDTLGLPIVMLIIFYFMTVGNLMLTFWVLVAFVIINVVIDLYTNRIELLNNIATGGKNNEKNK